MRKKILLIVGCAAAAVITAAALFFGIRYARQTWFWMDGGIYRRDAAVLNLNGRILRHPRYMDHLYDPKELNLTGTHVSAEDYEWLKARFPECRITWELPFQGAYYSLATRQIQLDHLTAEDTALLDYLPELSRVDAWECTDYDALHALQERRPECEVLYYVALTDGIWSSDMQTMSIRDADPEELMQKLPLLYNITEVNLTGAPPEYEALTALTEAFPDITFHWEAEIGGSVYPDTQEVLDLRGTGISPEDARSRLRYFPYLDMVDLRDCGYTEAEKTGLADLFPDCFFLWELNVLGRIFPTDADEIDISGIEVTDSEQIEAFLPYFSRLTKVVMCGCGLNSEEMDALNQRHPDVQFVWSIQLGELTVRTDDTYFIPVKYGKQVTNKDLEEFHYCHDMISIDLGHNPVSECSWAAEMPHLRYLLLADTRMKDISPIADHTELVYLELFMTQVRDTTPLLSCTALEDLNLCYTYADVGPVSQMTWLKRVWWSGRWEAAKVLPTALPNTIIETKTASSTGAGWRSGPLYYEMRDYMGMWYMYG